MERGPMSNSLTIPVVAAAAAGCSPPKTHRFLVFELKALPCGVPKAGIKHKWMRQVAMET